MAKVTVTPTKDFFDRANQQIKKAGTQYQVHENHAKTLGNAVSVTKVVEPAKAAPAKAEAPKAAKDMTTGNIKKAAPKKAKKK